MNRPGWRNLLDVQANCSVGLVVMDIVAQPCGRLAKLCGTDEKTQDKDVVFLKFKKVAGVRVDSGIAKETERPLLSGSRSRNLLLHRRRGEATVRRDHTLGTS